MCAATEGELRLLSPWVRPRRLRVEVPDRVEVSWRNSPASALFWNHHLEMIRSRPLQVDPTKWGCLEDDVRWLCVTAQPPFKIYWEVPRKSGRQRRRRRA